jgi:hypothetical protein
MSGNQKANTWAVEGQGQLCGCQLSVAVPIAHIIHERRREGNERQVWGRGVLVHRSVGRDRVRVEVARRLDDGFDAQLCGLGRFNGGERTDRPHWRRAGDNE